MIQNRVSLTPRDMRLMEILYHSVALSFPQIGKKVFPGKNKSTILNRLRRLEQAGILRRMRIQGFAAPPPMESIKVVFQLTRNGIRELSKWQGATVQRDEPVRLHGSNISHDLLLVDLADALKAYFPNATTTDGRLWKGGANSYGAKPDLILELPTAQKPWAVELELTAKSEKRYRDIVLRYRLSREFDRVLYVTDNRQVVTRLNKILEGKFMKLEASVASKFTHVSLENILTPFTQGGGNDERCLT